MMTFQFVTLIDRVAHECNVEPAAILGKSRVVQAAEARSIAAYCARHLGGTSYERLGALFSRTKRGAYGIERRAAHLMEYDKRTIRIVNRVMEMEAVL
jgi:chromosomal replication initiation ATPase DnaA